MWDCASVSPPPPHRHRFQSRIGPIKKKKIVCKKKKKIPVNLRSIIYLPLQHLYVCIILRYIRTFICGPDYPSRIFDKYYDNNVYIGTYGLGVLERRYRPGRGVYFYPPRPRCNRNILLSNILCTCTRYINYTIYAIKIKKRSFNVSYYSMKFIAFLYSAAHLRY